MEEIEKRDGVEIETTTVVGKDGEEIEIKMINKDPFEEYHTLAELGSFYEMNNVMRYSYRLRYRDIYFKYSRLTQKEILTAKYLIGRENVSKRWLVYLSVFAGYCTSMLVRSLTEVKYEVLDPSEDFFLYSYLTKIPRYLGVQANIYKMNIIGFLVPEQDPKDSLNDGDDQVVGGKSQEMLMLAHQIDHYQRRRVPKFDFAHLGEKEDYRLI